jgi:hypothetical protein
MEEARVGEGTLILTGAIAEIKTNGGVSTAQKAPPKGGSVELNSL